MADVTIQSTITKLKWQGSTAPDLEIELLDPAVGGDGVPMNPGPSPFFLKAPCTLDGSGFVVVPAVTLPSTEDSSRPDARYRARFRFNGSLGSSDSYKFSVFSDGFRVPASPTSTTWAEIDENMRGALSSTPLDKIVSGDLEVGGTATAAEFIGSGAGLHSLPSGVVTPNSLSSTGSVSLNADTDSTDDGEAALTVKGVTKFRAKAGGAENESLVPLRLPDGGVALSDSAIGVAAGQVAAADDARLAVWHSQGTILRGTVSGMEGNIGEPSIIFDTPQILTSFSQVYRMWFGAGWISPNVWVAESADAMPGSWIVRPTPVITGHVRFRAIKDGSTYYGFAATPTGSRIDRFTSSDGITWTLTHAGVITPGSGWEATNVQSSRVFIESGVWNLCYDGGDATPSYSTGLATSTDLGITWTKDVAHNPIIPNSGRVDVHKVGSTYYAWGQYIPPGTLLPSDVYRWSAPALTGPWTRTTNSTFPRATADEGVNTSLGQDGDVSLVEVGGKTYLFYTATFDGSAPVGSHIKLAVSNLPLSQIVLTDEGRNIHTDGMNSASGTIGYTPVVSSTAGTITTAGTVSGQFQIIQGRCFFEADVSITTNGTGSGQVTISLPAKASNFNYAMSGREANLNGKSLGCVVSPNGAVVNCLYYDATYPGANGARFIVSGSFALATS